MKLGSKLIAWMPPTLAVVLLGTSLLFLFRVVGSLAKRDYVSGILLMFVAFALLRVGTEMMRWTIVKRR